MVKKLVYDVLTKNLKKGKCCKATPTKKTAVVERFESQFKTMTTIILN
jgi:hypothetical protein